MCVTCPVYIASVRGGGAGDGEVGGDGCGCSIPSELLLSTPAAIATGVPAAVVVAAVLLLLCESPAVLGDMVRDIGGDRACRSSVIAS